MMSKQCKQMALTTLVATMLLFSFSASARPPPNWSKPKRFISRVIQT